MRAAVRLAASGCRLAACCGGGAAAGAAPFYAALRRPSTCCHCSAPAGRSVLGHVPSRPRAAFLPARSDFFLVNISPGLFRPRRRRASSLPRAHAPARRVPGARAPGLTAAKSLPVRRSLCSCPVRGRCWLLSSETSGRGWRRPDRRCWLARDVRHRLAHRAHPGRGTGSSPRACSWLRLAGALVVPRGSLGHRRDALLQRDAMLDAIFLGLAISMVFGRSAANLRSVLKVCSRTGLWSM